MSSKIKNTLLVTIFLVIIAFISTSYFIRGIKESSEAERRELAQFPETSVETFLNGRFMKDFESFSLDQFPFRDGMRSIKAIFEKYGFGNKENHDLYYHNGHLANVMYPMDKNMLDVALTRFNYLYDTYLDGKDKNVYLSFIPDKNAYLADDAGMVSVDYDEYIKYMIDGMPEEMKYIDISELLSDDDFYFTDQHWRQEKIVDVADAISKGMGNPSLSDKEYTEIKLDTPFYGTYYYQWALPGVAPDSISYLTNENIEGCRVGLLNDYGKMVNSVMYDLSKAEGRDPYEMYLSGTQPFIVIINDNADTDKELVIFRDSFGSSISPILAQSYRKITICDTRYIFPDLLGDHVNFEKCDDVLFIYSTLIVDAATALRDVSTAEQITE